MNLTPQWSRESLEAIEGTVEVLRLNQGEGSPFEIELFLRGEEVRSYLSIRYRLPSPISLEEGPRIEGEGKTFLGGQKIILSDETSKTLFEGLRKGRTQQLLLKDQIFIIPAVGFPPLNRE